MIFACGPNVVGASALAVARRLVVLCHQYQGTVSDFEMAAWMLYSNRQYLPRKTRVMIDFPRETLAG